ncbi:DUF5133 domain-containing protein [Streptomyces resistomycificus]|uniref:DUF5133 domain-containing protein n=1 Tax=Streptomyces resistomycificus TaxID=67356 RepID=UPI0007C42B99|nr:DUF5133 domain-containing protein [Streptomyces resistomycificus]
MLTPHPAFLRRLVDEYESLRAQETARGQDAPSSRALDLAYTLCVSTGTRDVGLALEAAGRLLSDAPDSRGGSAVRRVRPAAAATETRTVAGASGAGPGRAATKGRVAPASRGGARVVPMTPESRTAPLAE